MRTDDDHSPISAQNAKRLFADWKAAPAIVLAVSGGPDSIALMWLAARWRSTLARGPRLIAVTVDHGLRAEAAAEAREVKRLRRALRDIVCWHRQHAPAVPRIFSPRIPETIKPRRC